VELEGALVIAYGPHLVCEAAKIVKIPIVGMGGIQNAADAIEFMRQARQR